MEKGETMIPRDNHLPQVPTAQEYASALQRLYYEDIITENQKFMIVQHSKMPDLTITATEMAILVGYKSWRGVNLQYGILGKRLRNYLSYSEEGIELYIIAYFLAPGEVGNSDWLLIMHQEVADAIKLLGWR